MSDGQSWRLADLTFVPAGDRTERAAINGVEVIRENSEALDRILDCVWAQNHDSTGQIAYYRGRFAWEWLVGPCLKDEFDQPAAPEKKLIGKSLVPSSAKLLGRYREARKSLRGSISRQSRQGLDWMNFFLADVQTAFSAFVTFYLADLGWAKGQVGLALTVGTLAASSARFLAALSSHDENPARF